MSTSITWLRMSPTHASPRPPMPAGQLRERGLSLVELMVALVISSLILIGLVQVFVSSRATYDVDEGLARLQENGRFAMDFIVRDVRMAGNMGCFNLNSLSASQRDDSVINNINPTLLSFQFARGAIEGFDYNGTNPGDSLALPSLYPVTTDSNTTPPLNIALVGAAAPGSDVLLLRGMDTETVPIVSYATDELVVSESAIVKEDQMYLVTDCYSATIFEATSVATSGGQSTIRHDTGGTSVNTCSDWGDPNAFCKKPKKPYQPTTGRLARFNTVAYYIGAGANGGPSLFRRSWADGGPQDLELVEGVENMQVLYGYNEWPDRPSRGPWNMTDRYVPANQLPVDASGQPNWAQVTTVRVSLLVTGRTTASTSGLSDTDVDVSTYGVGGVTIDPVNDKRQRRVFTTTINVRNR